MHPKFRQFLNIHHLPVTEGLEQSGFRIGDVKFSLQGTDGEQNLSYCNETRMLKATVRFVQSGTEESRISVTITNVSEEAFGPIDVLEPLNLKIGLPADQLRYVYANGGTTESYYPPEAYRMRERNFAWEGVRIESHPSGRSSNLFLPLLIGSWEHEGATHGFFTGLEWSGEWYMQVTPIDSSSCELSAGVKVNGIILQAGEVLELPDVHFGLYAGTPEEGTQALRQYLYREICPTYQGKPLLPPVTYDAWFGIENELNQDIILREAQRAAELGVEVFAVDASWFPGDFPMGVGNWHEVDRNKFPDGLEAIAENVRSLGMHFGLWFEPERAGADTWLYKSHPEWFLQGESPAFFHLNLAIPEVQDYLIDLIGGWIERLDIRWSRWDYNIDPHAYWHSADPTLKIQFAYMKGLYRVLDELMTRYPNWMVEQCASGGRRIDLGTMKRAHAYWFSDQTVSAINCRYMQARANRFLPGHLLNSSVAVNLGQGDEGFNDTSILSRMLGKLAFDGDIASWSPELTVRMAEQVQSFKSLRHLFVQNFYQLLPQPSSAEDWDAALFADEAGDWAALFVFAGCKGGKCRISLKGLQPDAAYRITAPSAEARKFTGAELQDGLTVELAPHEGSLRVVERVSL